MNPLNLRNSDTPNPPDLDWLDVTVAVLARRGIAQELELAERGRKGRPAMGN